MSAITFLQIMRDTPIGRIDALRLRDNFEGLPAHDLAWLNRRSRRHNAHPGLMKGEVFTRKPSFATGTAELASIADANEAGCPASG
jgi:hypothetical protein